MRQQYQILIFFLFHIIPSGNSKCDPVKITICLQVLSRSSSLVLEIFQNTQNPRISPLLLLKCKRLLFLSPLRTSQLIADMFPPQLKAQLTKQLYEQCASCPGNFPSTMLLGVQLVQAWLIIMRSTQSQRLWNAENVLNLLLHVCEYGNGLWLLLTNNADMGHFTQL